MIIILSAPSGCGKSSIAQALLSQDDKLVLSISATTRPSRPGEIDGIDYFFKSLEDFKSLDLLEYANIYGNLYGTPRDYVEAQIKNKKDLLFDIDSHGAYQIRSKAETKVVSIFILPPSIEALKSRLQARNQDRSDQIDIRLAAAQEEMSHANAYDYIVVNDDFDIAVHEIQNIIAQERVKG